MIFNVLLFLWTEILWSFKHEAHDFKFLIFCNKIVFTWGPGRLTAEHKIFRHKNINSYITTDEEDRIAVLPTLF